MIHQPAAVPTDAAIRAAIKTLSATPFRRVQELRYHCQPNDFYSSCNDCAVLDANRDLWEEPPEPAEIDWNTEQQLHVAREVSTFVEELRDVPEESNRVTQYGRRNPFWNNADALVQYGLMRARRPSMVVECGCGWSSLLLARALEKNLTERPAEPTRVIQIEPYPRRDVLAGLAP